MLIRYSKNILKEKIWILGVNGVYFEGKMQLDLVP
jgi:hypothetical protein